MLLDLRRRHADEKKKKKELLGSFWLDYKARNRACPNYCGRQAAETPSKDYMSCSDPPDRSNGENTPLSLNL